MTTFGELSEIENEIKAIAAEHGYSAVDPGFCLLGSSPIWLTERFSCHDRALELNGFNPKDVGIVTGFGPTNSPTAGTLSVMLRAIALQQAFGSEIDVIISDLGAWNSRNLDWLLLRTYAGQFQQFIQKLGFDSGKGTVRTHMDRDGLVASGLVAKVMTEQDFLSNHEATDSLYDRLQLRSGRFGVIQDMLYTVGDIVAPLLRGKKAVLVVAGIEEHYFVTLARLAVERMHSRFPGTFFEAPPVVAGLYANIIDGLPPYPKMSKSIPDSAIRLGEPCSSVQEKLLANSPRTDRIVLQLIQQACGWQAEEISDAEAAFGQRELDPTLWHSWKVRYVDYFNEVSQVWLNIVADSSPPNPFN